MTCKLHNCWNRFVVIDSQGLNKTKVVHMVCGINVKYNHDNNINTL